MYSNAAFQVCRRCGPIVKLAPRRLSTSSLEFYEPPYLKSVRSKVPVYEAITVQVKGYDFVPLENYQRFAHNVAEYMNLNVETCWAHPGRNYTVRKYKPYTKMIDSSYKLTMFERNIKLINVPATKLPVYSEVLQAGLPEGAQLNVMTFDEDHYNDRFVPDHDLKSKLKELDEAGGPPEDADTNQFTW